MCVLDLLLAHIMMMIIVCAHFSGLPLSNGDNAVDDDDDDERYSGDYAESEGRGGGGTNENMSDDIITICAYEKIVYRAWPRGNDIYKYIFAHASISNADY